VTGGWPGRPGARRGLGFPALLLAEYTKLVTVRAAVWCLLAAAVGGIVVTAAATAAYAAQWATMSASGRAHLRADPAGVILHLAAPGTSVAACVLGVLVIAGEYATGMIQASMLMAPRRASLLAAKAAVLGVAAFAGAVLVAVAALLTGALILGSRAHLAASDPAVAGAVLRFGLSLAGAGVLAVGAAALIRRVAGAITVALVTVIVVPALAAQFPGRAGAGLAAVLPAGDAVAPGAGTAFLSPWQSLAVRGAWVLVVLLLAMIRLGRDDVPRGEFRS
jgi:ABC-2 type transport system permease protein